MVAITFSEKTISRLEKGGKPKNESEEDVTVDLELSSSERRFLHTIILYDVDAPYPDDPVKSPYLHWIVANIEGNDPKNGDTIVPYLPPSPPADSPDHLYVLLVLRQIYPLEFLFREHGRANFPIDEFISDNNLKIVGKVTAVLGQEWESPESLSPLEPLGARFADYNPYLGVNDSRDFDNLEFDPDYIDYPPRGHDLNLEGKQYNSSKRLREKYTEPRSGNPKSQNMQLYRQHHHRRTSREPPPPFKSGSGVTGEEKEFCKCEMEVMLKALDGNEEYIRNPYAICAASTGTTSRYCSEYYDFEKFSNKQLMAYMKYHNFKIPIPFDKSTALNMIEGRLKKYYKQIKK